MVGVVPLEVRGAAMTPIPCIRLDGAARVVHFTSVEGVPRIMVKTRRRDRCIWFWEPVARYSSNVWRLIAGRP